MSDSIQNNAWLTDRADGRRFAAAFAAGLALELAVLAVALPILTHQRPPSDKQSQVVKLSIEQPTPVPPAPPPPKPVPKIVPPKPVITPPPLPPPPPLPVAPQIPLPVIPLQPSHVARHLEHVRPVQPPPPVTPPPVQQTPPTPTPPPPPTAPSAPSAGELDLFKAAMRRAVQDAAVDPSSAEMAHESGIVRVAFTYQDGAVSGIQLVTSCGFPLLDDAAVAAARNAAYPPEPAGMAGKPYAIVVDVIFRPQAADIDGD